MTDDSVTRALRAGDLAPGSKILVAVSGGPDSVALLHGLAALAPLRGWLLRVGHINHRLRDEESDGDEAFVYHASEELKLPVDVVGVDTREFALERRLSLETAARELRYEVLRDILRRWSGNVIATGHTLDDQAETVILRLLHGTGLRGLSAMRPRTTDIVRPLLSVPRESVIEFLQTRGIPYRLDSSNTDRRHARNRTRLDVLPLLERHAPGSTARLARTAALLQPDAGYLDAEVAGAYSAIGCGGANAIDFRGWRALHPALRRGVLRLLVEMETGRPPDIPADLLLRAEDALLGFDPRRGHEIHVGHGIRLRAGGGQIWIPKAEPNLASWEPKPVVYPGDTEIMAGSLRAGLITAAGDVEHMLAVVGPWHALIDADELDAGLTLRPRRPGDVMRPLGSPGRRKVQDIMVDRHVPAALREFWPLVTIGEEILWIPGAAAGERGRVRPETTRILHLRFVPSAALQSARIPRRFPRI
jgi:tRNA(Ile)-lysidine synthase